MNKHESIEISFDTINLRKDYLLITKSYHRGPEEAPRYETGNGAQLIEALKVRYGFQEWINDLEIQSNESSIRNWFKELEHSNGDGKDYIEIICITVDE